MNKEASQWTPMSNSKDEYKMPETDILLNDGNSKKENAVIDMDQKGDFKTLDGNDEEEEYSDWDDDPEDDDKEDINIISRIVIGIQNIVSTSYARLSKVTKGHLPIVLLLACYFAYIIAAITYKAEGEDFWRLIVCTIFGIFMATRYKLLRLLKLAFAKLYGSDTLTPLARDRLRKVQFFMRWMMYGAYAIIMFYVLYSEGRKDISRLRSLPGLVLVILFCLLMSNRPQKINWHTVYVSVGLQFLCTLLFLKWSFGRSVLIWIQDRLDEFFANSKAGSVFLFGETYEDHYMVFGALPLILIMGATMSVLYYLGAMQLVVNAVGSFLCFLLDTDPVESTSVAAGIFLEGVIAILSLKPFLPNLTKSQLFVVLTSAFSSLGGAYLGVLVGMKVPLEYLFTGMMISAPATFTVCKLMFPETKTPKKSKAVVPVEVEKQNGLFEAVQTGSTSMLPLVGNIIAIIFVFMSVISWLETTTSWFGDRVGVENLTLSTIFSYVLYPVSLAMGIELTDCKAVAKLWGYRITSSNVVAFLQLIQMRENRAMMQAYQAGNNFTAPLTYDGDVVHLDLWNTTLIGGTLSERSEAIVTYSLCGFSSILSVGITIGVFYSFLPHRRAWISTIPMKALLAGNIANFMSGCFASFFY